VARSPDAGPSLSVRLAQFLIHSEESATATFSEEKDTIALHIVLFPAEAFPIAKQFWQHTGLGISSRMAERCLALLAEDSALGAGNKAKQSPTSPVRTHFSPRNKHYASKGAAVKGVSTTSANGAAQSPIPAQGSEDLCADQATYMEERYGRNMPLSAAIIAKRTLRRRIAGVLAHEEDSSPVGKDELRPSTRGVEGVTEDEVYLFPTGMSAIWSAHRLCLNALPPTKSVCFGCVWIYLPIIDLIWYLLL
jgi:cystathionine gamma-synthase